MKEENCTPCIQLALLLSPQDLLPLFYSLPPPPTWRVMDGRDHGQLCLPSGRLTVLHLHTQQWRAGILRKESLMNLLAVSDNQLERQEGSNRQNWEGSLLAGCTWATLLQVWISTRPQQQAPHTQAKPSSPKAEKGGRFGGEGRRVLPPGPTKGCYLLWPGVLWSKEAGIFPYLHEKQDTIIGRRSIYTTFFWTRFSLRELLHGRKDIGESSPHAAVAHCL